MSPMRPIASFECVRGSPSVTEYAEPPTIWQRIQRREWLLTVEDYSEEIASRLQSENAVNHVEVRDLNLEEVFKDYVKGRRDAA